MTPCACRCPCGTQSPAEEAVGEGAAAEEAVAGVAEVEEVEEEVAVQEAAAAPEEVAAEAVQRAGPDCRSHRRAARRQAL